MTRHATFIFAVLFATAFVGCRDATHASGTALFVIADMNAIPGITQLRFDGEADAGIAFADQVLPPDTASALGGKQSVRILLRDSLAGETLDISVTGLTDGKPAASGSQSATVVLGTEVEVNVLLLPISVGGTCGATQCQRGQECSNNACVCDAKSCPGGCCAGNVCNQPLTVTSCGSSGKSCTTCNPGTIAVADNCSSSGTCLCGITAGCGAGQRCAGGQCVCDATSCAAGCCSGNVCELGTQNSSCGKGGAACATCSGTQSCQSQQCGCNATSCPTGCCSGNVCEVGTQNSSCGKGGAACASCNGTQSCQNQQCLCDSSTCGGCCSGATCEPGNQDNACGKNGEVCQMCSCNGGGHCH